MASIVMTRRPWVLALFFSMMLVAFGTKEVRAQLTPQQKQEIHVHYQQATRSYDLGKYQEAVEEYQKVYEIDGDPVMLYNIAQAYRLNDQPQ
jgi:outer membrane protein assembly factor BamD (BamD/ComL family)